MEFSKIKFNGKQVKLRWAVVQPNGEEHSHQLTSPQMPDPALTNALSAFLPAAMGVMELPDDYNVSLRVTGLSINREENDGRLGLVITLMKGLKAANSPMVLNTPHLREDVDSECSPGFMPHAWLSMIADAEKAARDYVEGKRQQGELFEGDAKGERAPAGVGSGPGLFVMGKESDK